jgi:hypothetical protein
LSEELDPEIMRSLQTELFAEMSATIQGWRASSRSTWATP